MRSGDTALFQITLTTCFVLIQQIVCWLYANIFKENIRHNVHNIVFGVFRNKSIASIVYVSRRDWTKSERRQSELENVQNSRRDIVRNEESLFHSE